MPRREAAVKYADVPSNARKFLRSTMVTDGYHASLHPPEQRITGDWIDGLFSNELLKVYNHTRLWH
jgi:hypothetical protein